MTTVKNIINKIFTDYDGYVTISGEKYNLNLDDRIIIRDAYHNEILYNSEILYLNEISNNLLNLRTFGYDSKIDFMKDCMISIIIDVY